jgi:hypothetical protein
MFILKIEYFTGCDADGERVIVPSLAIIELIISAVLIIFDILMPTLLILVIAAGSLIVRREKISSLGLKKAPERGGWSSSAWDSRWPGHSLTSALSCRS